MNKYNTFWKRLWAAIIDGIILYPLVFVDTAFDNSNHQPLFVIGKFLSTFLYILYFIILHAKYGQTIGKKLMNIKVIDIAEINLIGFKRATIRELPWIIANGLIFLYLLKFFFLKNTDLIGIKEKYDDLSFIISFAWLAIELISMLTNPKRRAVHDWLAKSVVIKTKN